MSESLLESFTTFRKLWPLNTMATYNFGIKVKVLQILHTYYKKANKKSHAHHFPMTKLKTANIPCYFTKNNDEDTAMSIERTVPSSSM